MTAGNLESKIREFNRAILQIKTSHPVVSNMIAYWGKYTWPDPGSSKLLKFEITYVDGGQPIITWIGETFSGTVGYILFGEPSGNKQIMWAGSSSVVAGENYTLYSTRKIIGIRRIS